MTEREHIGIAVPPLYTGDSGSWLVELITVRQREGQRRGVRYYTHATHNPTGATCTTEERGQRHVARADALRLYHMLAYTPVSKLPPSRELYR